MDSDEELESVSNATTLELGEVAKSKSASTKGKGTVSKTAGSNPKSKAAAGENLRDIQWQVIHEEQLKIKKEHPEWTAKQVLTEARARLFGCKTDTACENKLLCMKTNSEHN